MKMPMDYRKRINLVDKITNVETFTFNEIEELNKDDGDLFITDKDGDYGIAVVFIENKYYSIIDNKMNEISKEELKQYEFYNRNLFDSPYQDFLKREGLDKFNELSEYDKADVYIGQYFNKRINATIDDIINRIKESD